MFTRSCYVTVSLALPYLLIAGAAAAKVELPATVPSQLRNSNEPVHLTVSVPQEELYVRADPAIEIDATSHGLVGGIIERTLAQGRHKKSHSEIAPLRRSLEHFAIKEVADAVSRTAFSGITWITPVDAHDSFESRGRFVNNNSHNAAITFDYGIDFEYSRSTVFCQLQFNINRPLSRPSAHSGLDSTPLRFRAHVISNFANLPRVKSERIQELSGLRNREFKESLMFGFRACADLLARQIADADFLTAIARSVTGKRMIFANETSPLTQDSFWLVEGHENVVTGRLGTLGLKATYVKSGSVGAITYSPRGYPVHQRTQDGLASQR